MISFMHNDAAVDSDGELPTYGKPKVILFYNLKKRGVEKRKLHYSLPRAGRSMVIFYGYTILNF